MNANLPPDWEREELDSIRDVDFEMDAYCEYRSSLYGDRAHHQIGGYAEAVQDPHMELQCQLVTNGVYLGNSDYLKDARYEELKAGASDWRLLLQLDFNKDFNPFGGESGMLYCWIRREDSLAGRFDRSWMIFQCT